MITFDLSKQARTDAIRSLKRYFEENLEDPIGDLPAGLLLDFILEEIGPVIYNKAISDAQTRVVQHAGDLTGELFVQEFEYWHKLERKRKNRK